MHIGNKIELNTEITQSESQTCFLSVTWNTPLMDTVLCILK